jgi:hypothetical protein
MTSFQFCYNLNKHTFDQGSILGLHPASWTVTIIEPLIQMNCCDIVTNNRKIVLDVIEAIHAAEKKQKKSKETLILICFPKRKVRRRCVFHSFISFHSMFALL